ncbi:polyisoprenoid-binding protein [Priestia megaterium]|nr:polyisoprenoid-binding protein [Priestia megaterium]
MTKWSIDGAHTDVSFAVKHMGLLNVKGNFAEITGEASTDDNGVLTGVTATIQVESVTTRNKDRDGHLLGEDFFHAAKFPTITFKSKSVKVLTANEYEITGDLTIKGISKQVVLKTKALDAIVDIYGLNRMAFEVKTVINRMDYDIKWNQTIDTGNGLLVGTDIKIAIEGQMTSQ